MKVKQEYQDYVGTTKLDLHTELCLMASLIYSSMSLGVEKSIEKAAEIDKAVEKYIEANFNLVRAVKVEKEEQKISTNRLDLKTRICLMSALIFSSVDAIEVDEAVEAAVDIENAADARVRKMKKDNPIFPSYDGKPENLRKTKEFYKERKSAV